MAVGFLTRAACEMCGTNQVPCAHSYPGALLKRPERAGIFLTKPAVLRTVGGGREMEGGREGGMERRGDAKTTVLQSGEATTLTTRETCQPE